MKTWLLLGLLIMGWSLAQGAIKNADVSGHPPDLSNKEKKAIVLTAKAQAILEEFRLVYKDNQQLLALRDKTLKLGTEAVPALIEIMKNSQYPDKNRWIATFLMGKIMGVQSAAFVAKFTQHPQWVMRLASLKTLLALKQKDFAPMYRDALQDPSLMVRSQALTNIHQLQIKEEAQHVWAMLYNKDNYQQSQNGKNKRMDIIREVIKVVGDLDFKKAQEPLLKMINNKKYQDLFAEIDVSLGQLTGKKSPEGNQEIKRNYWKKYSLQELAI